MISKVPFSRKPLSYKCTQTVNGLSFFPQPFFSFYLHLHHPCVMIHQKGSCRQILHLKLHFPPLHCNNLSYDSTFSPQPTQISSSISPSFVSVNVKISFPCLIYQPIYSITFNTIHKIFLHWEPGIICFGNFPLLTLFINQVSKSSLFCFVSLSA